MLHIQNFRKFYGCHLALDIDDFTFEPGIYWVKGQNGSGKSTLLKAIAGILYFEGDIILNNHISLKNHPIAYRSQVNFAEAEPIFPGFLTGKELIRLFASAKDAPEGQETYFIQNMKMDTYLNQPIREYSSGMVKKLSLVLAFIGKPKIILLDEPLITLDQESLQVLNNWIAENHRENGTSFLLTSHQPLEPAEFFPVKEILVHLQSIKFDN
jgi:ABC-2 type transport system ATP-binding protein